MQYHMFLLKPVFLKKHLITVKTMILKNGPLDFFSSTSMHPLSVAYGQPIGGNPSHPSTAPPGGSRGATRLERIRNTSSELCLFLVGWAWKTSRERKHANQRSKPPQLTPFDLEVQRLLSMLL